MIHAPLLTGNVVLCAFVHILVIINLSMYEYVHVLVGVTGACKFLCKKPWSVRRKEGR